jgi:hypothetical protein
MRACGSMAEIGRTVAGVDRGDVFTLTAGSARAQSLLSTCLESWFNFVRSGVL